MEYEKNYNVTTDGISQIYYEDASCKVKLIVSDFRESTWWIGAKNIINMRSGNVEKMSNKQKYELYRRVSADVKRELFTDEFKFIEEDIKNIDYSKSILDIEG